MNTDERTPDGYVPLSAAARRMDLQTQYASRYAFGRNGMKNLGEGLRLRDEDPGNYHGILIHEDDVEEFVRRHAEMKRELHQG